MHKAMLKILDSQKKLSEVGFLGVALGRHSAAASNKLC